MSRTSGRETIYTPKSDPRAHQNLPPRQLSDQPIKLGVGKGTSNDTQAVGKMFGVSANLHMLHINRFFPQLARY